MRADADDEEDDAADDEDAELVGRGAFRIDPSVAAEKLRDYQLPDARDFLVPWLRAAIAYGATRVEAGSVEGTLSFSFNGAAPDPEVLRELTAGLLQEEHGEAARHLAFGALALRRLTPASVEAAEEQGRTTIRVRWPRGTGPVAEALARLREAYGMTATLLLIDGEPVPDPAAAATPVRFWDRQRVRVAVFADALASRTGRVHVYKLGALVETVPFDLGGHYSAFFRNDGLTLSLSQASAVKDRQYSKTMRRLGRLRRRLARRERLPLSSSQVMARRAAAAAGTVGTAARRLWRRLRSWLAG